MYRNMIPESNGLYKVNMKQKISKVSILKRIAYVILFIFIVGFIFQFISNFIGREKISSSLYYAKVNGEKMEYNYSGFGDYTVVIDGAIATNLHQWGEISKKLQDLGLKVFVYNRAGYGFSNFSQNRTVKEQAEDLKILLRKAGVSGKLILVGEEYGSLVMTNFANLFPDNVSAMMLIKPLDEEYIKTEEYKDSIATNYYRSKLEAIGTHFGLTSLLSYFNLTYSVNEFEDSLDEYAKDEYDILKTKSNYRQAIKSEFNNLYNYEGNAQIDGLMSGKPLYIISNDENDSLKRLGDEDLTTIYKTKSKDKVISATDKDAIVSGISNLLRTLKIQEKKKVS